MLAGFLISSAALAETYSFGVPSQRSSVLTAEYWNPILDHVKKKTGVELVLRIARSAPESNDAIERGDYDFVYSNTIFQPKMAKSNYQVILRPHDEAITGRSLRSQPVPMSVTGKWPSTLAWMTS